ncbi:MAG: ferric reductase-like transmembrane domain-containing protein [Clostridiales Family XIII bacterium]|nr:ferric reductase-like transmembrane domain-containing protein [Clostridiales Family XIII bacterium]
MNATEIISSVDEYIDAYLWLGIPEVVKGLLIAVVFAVLFRKKMLKRPAVFYIYPIVYFILCVINVTGDLLLPHELAEKIEAFTSLNVTIILALDHLGLGTPLGIGLLIIVMFIGVLPKTELVKNLFSIRTEMSVIGATLLAGHGLAYLSFVFYYLTEKEAEWSSRIIYGIVGSLLILLLLVPWITSFRTIRKRMSARTWKRLQTWLGVPLFILMLVFGLALNTAGSLGSYPVIVDTWEITTRFWGGDEPISLYNGIGLAISYASAKIYLVLLVSYIVLRIKKVGGQKRSKTEVSELIEENSLSA